MLTARAVGEAVREALTVFRKLHDMSGLHGLSGFVSRSQFEEVQLGHCRWLTVGKHPAASSVLGHEYKSSLSTCLKNEDNFTVSRSYTLQNQRTGHEAGPYEALADAKAAGAVSVNYGVFFNAVISFLIVAFAVFLLIRGINTWRRQEETVPPPPTLKECKYCASLISIKATRCPQCTSQLAA